MELYLFDQLRGDIGNCLSDVSSVKNNVHRQHGLVSFAETHVPLTTLLVRKLPLATTLAYKRSRCWDWWVVFEELINVAFRAQNARCKQLDPYSLFEQLTHRLLFGRRLLLGVS